MSRSPRPPGSPYARAFDEPARGLGRIRAVATPLVVLLVLAAAWPGGEAWRIGALAGLLAVILVWSAVELVTIRRGHHNAELFRRGLLGLLIVLPVLVALSGGSSSPLTPALLPAALGANFLFPNVAGRLVTLALLAILWGTAADARARGAVERDRARAEEPARDGEGPRGARGEGRHRQGGRARGRAAARGR